MAQLASTRSYVLNAGSGRLVVQLSDTSKANGHLTDSLTSLTWVIPKVCTCQSQMHFDYSSACCLIHTFFIPCASQEKKKSVQFTGLAGGTASGDVLLFDVKLGELKWRASNCIEG